MSNIFKQFHDYQSRNVDHPSYEPLKQGILVLNPEEEKKRKRNEYHKEYYRRNKEKIKEYNRNYWKKTRSGLNHREELSGLQKQVYDYLLNQYRRGEDPARGSEIAKALGISDNSVYTAVFQLTKKGYLGRGTYGRYLLLKFPDNEESKEEKELTLEDLKSTHKLLVGRGYLDELVDKISTGLIAQNKELYEENQQLKEMLNKIKEAWIKHEKNTDAYYKQWQNSYGDLDQIIMNR